MIALSVSRLYQPYMTDPGAKIWLNVIEMSINIQNVVEIDKIGNYPSTYFVEDATQIKLKRLSLGPWSDLG